MQNRKINLSPFLLLLTAFIWGTAFVAQSVGMDYVTPFTFICTRYLIGGVTLLLCMPLLSKLQRGSETGSKEQASHEKMRQLILGGVSCGVVLFIASALQQFGIMTTYVGKAGFITALYIIFVPVIGIFLGKKSGISIWIGVVLAVLGLYFLCITDGLHFETGDLCLFACAVMFSIHILVIDHFSPLTDAVKMSCIQFFVSGVLGGIFMLLFEQPQWSDILQAAKPILYAGVLSSGAGYTLQIIGQRGMNPTVASLTLSMESVISVLAGMVLLHQMLTPREILGCVFMSAAIIIANVAG
ncbi:MAG: DMT family transporter [Eubacteriales bacterium]|nr:DMT family transporter [Eubacteriales bacterium]